MAEDFGYGGSTERYYTSAGEIQEGRMESTKMLDGQMVTTVRESRIVRTNGTEKLGKEAKEILLHLIAEIRKKLLGVVEATESVAAVVPKIIREYDSKVQEAERRANSLITDIQQREADLLNQADVLKQNKRLSFDEQEQLLERLEKSLHATIVVALKLLEEKFDPYFLELHGEVNARIKALLDLPLPLDDLDGSLCTLLDDVGVTRYLGNISDTRHMYEVKQKHDTKEAKLYLIGGSDNTETHNTVEAFNPQTGAWTLVSSMPTPRRGLAAACLGSSIYAVGGWDGTKALDSVERFDMTSGTWDTLPPMNCKRQGCGAVALDGKLYVIGGYDGKKCMDSVERYNPATNEWVFVAPMSVRRRGCVTVIFQDRIFAMGGCDVEHHRSVEVYDPARNRWTMAASMNHPRSFCGAAVLHGKIVAAGGWDGSRALDEVEAYNPSTDSWQLLTPMPYKCHGLCLGVANGQLFAVGGWDGWSRNRLDASHVYDVVLNKWTAVSGMQCERFSAGIAVV
jgi:N-acetylneuraminic acid mutarotase